MSITIGSPGSLLAAIPRLCGYHPSQAVALLFREQSGRRLEKVAVSRFGETPLENLAPFLDECEYTGSVLICAVGYGTGEEVTPYADAILALRPGLHDILRVHEGRYWSYLCQNPGCCPPEGTVFDLDGEQVSAELAASGLVVYPCREDRAAALLPALAGAESRDARVALLPALGQTARLVRQGRSGLALLRQQVTGAIETVRRGEPLDPGRRMELIAAVQHIHVRDWAWVQMLPEHKDAHLSLWRDALAQCPPEACPPVACLVAFTALQCGDGSLAMMALQRALEICPDYTMASLLASACFMAPADLRHPWTPEEWLAREGVLDGQG